MSNRALSWTKQYWVYVLIITLVVFVNVFANIIDSDSGQEYGRAYRLLHGMPYDNGPILTGALYGLFYVLGSPVLLVLLCQILLGCALFVLVRQTYYKLLPSLNFILFVIMIVFSSIGLRLLTYPVPYLLMMVFLFCHLFFALQYLRNSRLAYAALSAFFLAATYYAKNHSMVFVPGFFFLVLVFYWREWRKIARTTLVFYGLALAFVLPGLLTNVIHSGTHFWHYPNNWYAVKYNPVAYYTFWNYPNLFSQDYYMQHLNNFSTYGFPLVLLLLFALSFGKRLKFSLETQSLIVYFVLSLVPILVSKVPPTYQYLYAPYIFAVLLATVMPYKIGSKTIALLLIALFIAAGIGTGFYSTTQREYEENGLKAEELRTIDALTADEYAVLSRSENVRPYLGNDVITLPQLDEETATSILTGKQCVAGVSSMRYVLEDRSLPMSRFFSVWSPAPVDILGPCTVQTLHQGRYYVLYEVSERVDR